eukprot:6176442-Pleurochrysis_carterae.AAC.1
MYFSIQKQQQQRSNDIAALRNAYPSGFAAKRTKIITFLQSKGTPNKVRVKHFQVQPCGSNIATAPIAKSSVQLSASSLAKLTL